MRILAVRTHAFGDALMCTPAVTALARENRVAVLSGPSAYPVWSRLEGLEAVIRVPVPGNPLALLSWTLTHRLDGFDRVVFFGFSTALRLWLRLAAGCPVHSGAVKPLGGWERAMGFTGTPAALAYSRIAGVEPESLRPVFRITEREKAEALGLTGKGAYAVISPGGGRNPRQDVPEKRWSAEGWASVTAFLRSSGLRTVGVGGASDRRIAHGAAVDMNLAGMCSWGVTASVIAGSVLFAGNDSGPAHLAVAHGVPAVLVFGPTDPSALYPPDTVVSLVSGVRCSPCYSNGIFKGCREGGSCMASIDAEQVIEALRKVLQ